MVDFTINGINYRTIRKIDVFRQNNIVRRLLPALGGVASSVIASGATDLGSDEAKTLATTIAEEIFANLGPITKAIASMTDDDSNYIFQSCLSVVSRQNEGAVSWSNVMLPTGQLIFEDIDLATLYRLVWEVLRENLSGFFSSIAQILPQPPGSPE